MLTLVHTAVSSFRRVPRVRPPVRLAGKTTRQVLETWAARQVAANQKARQA